MPQEMKCGRCKQVLDFSQFPPSHVTRGRGYCRPCLRDRHQDIKIKQLDITKVVVTEKECSICHIVKPKDQFDKMSITKDGLCAHCKECRSARKKKEYESNKEEALSKNKQYYRENKEAVLAKVKEYYDKNRDATLSQKKEYYAKNRDVILAKGKAWSAANRDKINESCRAYKKQRERVDPKYKIDRRISNLIYQDLVFRGGAKFGKRWEEIVGYTVDELRAHLERLFKPDMNWGNYGSYWHIDHIRPKSWFNYTSYEDPEFKRCWSLDNLQPLEAAINIAKSNRYEG